MNLNQRIANAKELIAECEKHPKKSDLVYKLELMSLKSHLADLEGELIKVTTVEATRDEGAFCNPVIEWSYKITTGKRCKGLVSTQKYSKRHNALIAGRRMVLRLTTRRE